MVDNQLRDNDPPSTKEAYQKLLDAGYSMREAKEKIGVVVLTEIYDVMKENQSYDEKRYTNSLHKYTDGRASERYVRFEGKYIFLMGSTRLYGWNEEYYSYALYCLLKKLPNASVKYNQAKGWEDVDCHIELTSSTNAGKWKIKYLRAKDKFSVIDASGVQSLYSTVEDAKYALEKLL